MLIERPRNTTSGNALTTTNRATSSDWIVKLGGESDIQGFSLSNNGATADFMKVSDDNFMLLKCLEVQPEKVFGRLLY